MAESAPTTDQGRRGYVVVMFADLCDYTGLNEGSDPEEVDSLRRQLDALATGVILKHGGAVSQVYGDGFLAVFGFPLARENDARRAVEAAVELHEGVRQMRWNEYARNAFELRMHTGVAGGVVFARDGDAVGGRYYLTGDAVNTAARLCGAAARDEILVSSALMDGIEGFFAAEVAPDPMRLKGKSVPVPAHRVTGRSDVRTQYEARSRRGLTAFVGREVELESLDYALTESLEARGQFIVVSGAAGIGKSRLLAEFRSRVGVRNVRALHCSCESYGEMPPFEPFLQLLKQLFGIQPHRSYDDAATAIRYQLHQLASDADLESSAPVLLQQLFPQITPDRSRGEVTQLSFEGVLVGLIRALSEQAPLVLAFDDWQWADDGSRKVLDRLREDIKNRSVCIVVGIRTTEISDPLLSRIEAVPLGPFCEDESARVIAALRPQGLDLGVARALHRRSGGNPLFLEELCRSLPPDAHYDELALAQSGPPSTLRGVIQARVSSLPSDVAGTLDAASVIGIEFSLHVLAQILNTHDVPGAIQMLSQTDLVYETEVSATFRFKHGITRDVIYESVRIAERRRLHAAVADAIARTLGTGNLADQAEALAYHYRGAGNREREALFAELAGDKAVAASAFDRARFQYAAALRALDTLPKSHERKKRWLLISSSWAVACAYDSARNQLELLERAAVYADEFGEPEPQAQARYSLGWIHYALGDYVEAANCYQAALALAETAQSSKLVEQLWANLGQTYAAAGNYADGLAFLSRSIECKRGRSAREHRRVAQGFVYSLACRASVYSDMGDFVSADRDIAEALAELRDTEHTVEASVLAHEAMVEIRRGAWPACVAAAARGRKIAERLNSPFVYATTSAYEAYACWMLERAPTALLRLDEAVRWLEQRDNCLFISLIYGCLADALASAGDFARAGDYAERALARAVRGDKFGETAAYRVLAQISAAEGGEATRRPEEFLRKAVLLGEEKGAARDVAVTRLLRLELLADGAGDRRREADEILGDFDRWGMQWHAARVRLLVTP